MKTKEQAAAEYAKKVGGDPVTQAMAGTDFMAGWRAFEEQGDESPCQEETLVCTHSLQILAPVNRKGSEMHEVIRKFEKRLFTEEETEAMVCELMSKADALNDKYPNMKPISVHGHVWGTILSVCCGDADITRLYMTRCKRWR